MAVFSITSSRIFWFGGLFIVSLMAIFVIGGRQVEAAPFITCTGGGAPTALPFNTDGYVQYGCGEGNTINVEVVDPGGGYDAGVTCEGGQNVSTTFINGLGGGPTAQVYCVPAGTSGGPDAFFDARVFPAGFAATFTEGQTGATEPTVPDEEAALEAAITAERDAVIACDANAGDGCINNNPIIVIAKWAVNILSAVVGVVIVGVIVFAGIEYSSSGGDPGRTAAAKGRIVNAIIALVAYMFLFIALQWLIPGGLFSA